MLSNNTTIHYESPTAVNVWTFDDIVKRLAYFTQLKAFLKQVNLAQRYIYIFIIIFIVLGNALVLVATWRERSLHQPNKYFVASLAVADLLVGLILVPIQLHNNYEIFDSGSISIHLCRFMVWIDTIALTASIYALTFISIDRYLKISKPLQYKSRMTTSASLKIIFTIWLISTGFATYAATPNAGSNGILDTASSVLCFKQNMNFYIFLSISAFFLPIVVMVVMYILIFIVAHKRHKMLRNGELGQALNDQNHRTTFLQDLKVIRLFLVVIGVFIFCWLPYFVRLFHKYENPDFYRLEEKIGSITHGYQVIVTEMIVFMLPLFNSLCNPIIYACFDQTYRKAFKRMLFRRSSGRREQPNAIELRQVRRP